MKKELVTPLDTCLEELRAGRSVEECLAHFPELRRYLEPLLQIASRLQAAPATAPRPVAIRTMFLKTGATVPAPRAETAPRSAIWRGGLRYVFPRQPSLRLAAASLALLLVLWVATNASAQSVPGDLLYPLKLATERVGFVLALRSDQRAELRLTFAGRRLTELVSSLQSDGEIDAQLLRNLLRQAELALDEARPMPEEEYPLFLARIEHFNAYQKAILELLKPRVEERDARLLTDAIALCDQREGWIRGVWQEFESGKPLKRQWGPECRCD